MTDAPSSTLDNPKRIQLSRRKGWRKPVGSIVVSRPTRYGNPYRWQDYAIDYPADADWTPASWRGMSVSDFRGSLEGRFDWPEDVEYPTIAELVEQLRGHDLACWCPPGEPCHADVLLELANA